MRSHLSLLVLTVVASGCATPTPDVPDATLAREEAVNGFRIAVVDVCLASALSGTPVADLATETGPIVAATDASATGQVRPSETVWVSRQAEDVRIKASQNECQVSASGPSLRAARDAVAQALSDPHGFAPEIPGEASANAAGDVTRYSKTVGGRTFRVTLSGPGAQAQSGTLVAVVTSTPLA